jgi:hypothetical protein
MSLLHVSATWAIIRQHFLFGETIALYTLSLVPLGTLLLLLLLGRFSFPF